MANDVEYVLSRYVLELGKVPLNLRECEERAIVVIVRCP